jgi:hypothetical protein
MCRVLSVVVALSFFSPGFAAAQQPCTTDARRIVDELYRHILERAADRASADMVRQLESGRATVKDLVRQIAKSPEHTRRFFRVESGESVPYERAVGTIYRHLLGRAPDDAGARLHAELAARSGSAAVIDAILSSDEYNEKFNDWGAPGSGGLRYCPPAHQTSSSAPTETLSGDSAFRHMDRNNDGVVTQAEWRGSRQAFRRRDWNNDGVLSGDELRVEPGAVATSGQTIVVAANQRWTDTAITVEAGDTLTFNVDGSVRLSEDSNDIAGPAGSQTGRRAENAPVPRSSAGGLIARIGDSAPIFVGDRRTLRAPVSGRLYLGVNDDHLEDNSGEFRVTVTVR